MILKPKINDYFAWVKEKYNLVNPRSDIGKALFYSIVETSKANGLNVYKYFELLLEELSKRKKDNTLDHIDDFLPWAKFSQEKMQVWY